MKNIIYIILLCVLSGNAQTKAQKQSNRTDEKKLQAVYRKIGTINLIPLGNVEPVITNEVAKILGSFYKQEVKIQKPQQMTADLKRTKLSRYSADSILKKYKSGSQTVLITAIDITIWNKDKKADWGIFGLGIKPGKTCVISTCDCRLGKNVSQKTKLSRIRKVAIHEVGHNLGLDHCVNQVTCVMHAANGRGAQIDIEREAFCESCKNKLINSL
jgi:archaemetzincin